MAAGTDSSTDQALLVSVKNLKFSYDHKLEPQLDGVDVRIGRNQRILLVGANGAGKSTLLRVIAGHHMFSGMTFDEFRVNGTGQPADQRNGMAYLGGVWRRKRTGFEGMEPFSMDIAAGEMMKEWQTEWPERRDELVRVLGINLEWRMHRVSDGQRKKVRIMLKLLRPFQLCLIDEFAVELDIHARKRFMDYLAKECTERGASVVYATHIFDQADDWATHIAFMRPDRKLSPVHELARYEPYQALLRRTGAERVLCPMYRMILDWLETASAPACQMAEPEETPKRSADIYDSGYEDGRLASRLEADIMRREREAWAENVRKKKRAEATSKGSSV